MNDSFTSSPAYYHKLFNDAMALVLKFGMPDLFVTFTMNPNHPDLINNVRSDRRSDKHLQVVTCNNIFCAHLQKLMTVLKKDQLLGPIQYYTYSIEFQVISFYFIYIYLY